MPQMSITGSNFPLVWRPPAAAPTGTTDMAIPRKQTHMVIRQSALFTKAGGAARVDRKLEPGTMTTLIRTEQRWAPVVRNGIQLGYVSQENLPAAQ